MSEPWDEEDEQTVAAMVDRGRAWIMERAAEAKAERERRATEVTTEAGRRLLDHARTVLLSRGTATITIVDGDVIDDVKAIEADAGSLDAAWNAVGSALWSNGGGSPYLSITCDLVGWCIVEAHNSNGGASVESEFASPDSIIAALHELAARLSSVADSEEEGPE